MRGAQGNGGVNPRVINLLAKQQFELVKNPANGIIFYQNEEGDVLDIQADIIGPVQTAYEGGIFRVKLVIESGFPQQAPKGYMMTKIFHPNVAPKTGEICVNTLKRDWNPAKWSLKHIFEVIKCLLIVPFPESSLNEEAGREFMDDYDAFLEHARVYTQIHAKPKAAQRELIIQRQKEEEKQSQQAQPPQQLLQENHPKLDSTIQTTQQLHQLEDSPMNGQKFNAPEEEMKLDSNLQLIQPALPRGFVIDVLSQVTNSMEDRPNVTSKTRQQMMDNENQGTGGFGQLKDFTVADNRKQEMILNSTGTYGIDLLTGRNQPTDDQNMDTSNDNPNLSRPAIIRRPSVLYKKKVETAKQRQDRYIRRV